MRRRRANISEVDVEIVRDVEAEIMHEPAADSPAPPDQAREATLPEPLPELPRSTRESRPQPAPIPASEQLRNPVGDVCEIVLWRGYVRAAFYARPLDAEDPLAAIAQSPSFRHRGGELPEASGAAAAAHETLTQLLEETGWERVGAGRAWFSDRFRR